MKETLIFLLKAGITDTELEDGTVIENVHLIRSSNTHDRFIAATINGKEIKYRLTSKK
jgi:hypothetical protein